MGKNFKKIIMERLGGNFLEKGFTYDKLASRNGCYIFSKGDPAPSVEWYEGFKNRTITGRPSRDTIIITRSNFLPQISVALKSQQKKTYRDDLGRISGSSIQKWWPIEPEERLCQSFDEILQMMDSYGWKWFAQNDSAEE